MAVLSLTINNTILPDLREALCIRWGYAGDGTPADKNEFVRNGLIRFLKDEYAAAKANTAAENARIAALALAQAADVT